MKIRSDAMLVLAGAVLWIAGAADHPARAACFESGIGCTDSHYISKASLGELSCDALWTVRNTIYHERGYCFRTERAMETFSNDGCTVSNATQLTFNRFERSNIGRIVAVERAKGCR